jgi:hypothetical protein
VDLFTLRTDIVLAGSDNRAVELLNDIRLEGLLTLIERLLPLFHESVDFVDIILHLLNEDINVSYDLHSVVDEGVNVIRVPPESINTGLEGIAHLLNAIS